MPPPPLPPPSSRRPPPMALSLPPPLSGAPPPFSAAPAAPTHAGDAAEPAPHDPSHPWAALFAPSRLAPHTSAAAPTEADPPPPTPGQLDTHISSLTILPGGAENGQRVAQAGGFFAPSASPAPAPSPAPPPPVPALRLSPQPRTHRASPDQFQLSKPPFKAPQPLPAPSVGGAVAGGMRLSLPPAARMSRGASLPVPLPMSKSPSNSQALDPAEEAFRSTIAALSPAELIQSCQARPESTADLAPTDDVLILDIRPANAFRSARLRGSINVCAPSTLLKRRSVTVDQVGQELLGDGDGDMCSDPHSQFDRWRRSCPLAAGKVDLTSGTSIRRILVLDASTASLSDAGRPGMGGGGTCIAGLLRKFYDQEFEGQLAFLAGGFAALTALPEAEQLLLRTSPAVAKGLAPLTSLAPLDADGEASHISPTVNPLAPPHVKGGQRAMSFSLSLPSHVKANGWQQLQTRDGPTPAAVPACQAPPLAGSLTLPTRSKGLVQPGALPTEAFTTLTTVRGADKQVVPDPTDAPSRRLATTAANPFFDNIRQNRELANGVTEVVPLTLPPMSDGERHSLPRFLQELVVEDGASAAERDRKLANDFYDIDRQEQVRLNATLARLSETVADPRNVGQKMPDLAAAKDKDGDDCWFPFSIAAALERGEDNRYNNIWPYEHTRVRLREPRTEGDPGSDYLNASYAAPALQWGSERRYIATQAPLPATFDAFWTSIWEQGVKVLVMLAKEREAGRTQAHAYWDAPHQGTVNTHIVEQVAMDGHGAALPERAAKTDGTAAGGGGFFSAQDAGQDDEGPVFIRRVFRLSLAARPNEVRYVVQVQYLAWPDYFVPDSPDSLLNLIEMVDQLQNSAWGAALPLPPTPRPASPVEDPNPRSSSPAHSASAFASTGLGASEAQSPMLVHCSAGVGRTGAFIMVDSLLDALRRARRQGAALTPLRTWDCDSIPSPPAGLSDSDPTEHEPPAEQVRVLPLPPEIVLQPRGRERQRKRGRSVSGQRSAEVGGKSELGSSPMSASSSAGAGGSGKAATTSRRIRTRSKPTTSPPPPSNLLRSLPRRPSATSMVSISSSSSLASRADETFSTRRRGPMERAKWDTAAEVLLGTADLVKKATETLREQRMSSVQTARQYVFVHQAVLAGALRDLRRHPSSSAAAMKALSHPCGSGAGTDDELNNFSPTSPHSVASPPLCSPGKTTSAAHGGATSKATGTASANGAGSGPGLRFPASLMRQRSSTSGSGGPSLAPPFSPPGPVGVGVSAAVPPSQAP